MELSGKVALVTGAASGLGAATAKQLLAAGVRVIFLDKRFGSSATQRVSEHANHALHIEGDVTCEKSVSAAIERGVARFEYLHIVVNCAGIAPAARIVSRKGAMDLNDYEAALKVNLTGSFNVMRLAAATIMKQSPVDNEGQRGVIIQTASVAAFEGQIGQAAYSASKGGVVSMTLPAAREFAAQGIRVMTIAPGVMDTPMMSGLEASVRSSLKASVPFPKRLGMPEEYARLAQHIIENDYLNGSVVRLDGGLRMG